MILDETKKVLLKIGVTENAINQMQKDYDLKKINELIEGSSTPKEAFEKIHDFCPSLSVEKLLEEMDFIQSQFDAALKGEKSQLSFELSAEELDAVVGGGIGDWWSQSWRSIAWSAATAVVLGLVAAPTVASMGASAPVTIAVGVITAAVVVGASVLGSVQGYNEQNKA